VLVDVIPNRLMVSTSSNYVLMTLKRMLSFTFGTRVPNNLLGVTITMYHAPLTCTKTFVIFNIQPTSMFHLGANTHLGAKNHVK
jgi:hypothetical protein